MAGHHYGLFFRNGWFSRSILKTAALFIGADAFVKYEYGIDVNYDFNTNAWNFWMSKTPEERATLLDG